MLRSSRPDRLGRLKRREVLLDLAEVVLVHGVRIVRSTRKHSLEPADGLGVLLGVLEVEPADPPAHPSRSVVSTEVDHELQAFVHLVGRVLLLGAVPLAEDRAPTQQGHVVLAQVVREREGLRAPRETHVALVRTRTVLGRHGAGSRRQRVVVEDRLSAGTEGIEILATIPVVGHDQKELSQPRLDPEVHCDRCGIGVGVGTQVPASGLVRKEQRIGHVHVEPPVVADWTAKVDHLQQKKSIQTGAAQGIPLQTSLPYETNVLSSRSSSAESRFWPISANLSHHTTF